MMRGQIALVAALLVSAPVASLCAQSGPASVKQDLECAIWASHLAGTTTDSDQAQGAITLASHFIGRYEGATGKDIDDAMVARSLELQEGDINALAALCRARSEAYSKRMAILGERIVAAANAKAK